MNLKKNIWLCLPPFCAIAVDYAVTSLGQSDLYRAGNLNMANEGNPVVQFFMLHHSLGLLVVTILWLGLLFSVICLSGRRIAMIVAAAVVIGNSWGAATWLYPRSFWFAIALFIVNSSVLVVCVEKTFSLHPAIAEGKASGA